MASEMLEPVGPAVLTRFAQLAGRVLNVPLVHISVTGEHHRCVESSQAGAAPDDRYLTDMSMPLVTWDGRQVGTLSLRDRRQRRWSDPQIQFLRELCVRIVGSVDIGPPDEVM